MVDSGFFPSGWNGGIPGPIVTLSPSIAVLSSPENFQKTIGETTAYCLKSSLINFLGKTLGFIKVVNFSKFIPIEYDLLK